MSDQSFWDTKWFDTVKPGSEIVARGVRDLDYLTAGKTYVAINGKEDGIFANRPFVTVDADDGKRHSCHLDRFIPLPAESESNDGTSIPSRPE